MSISSSGLYCILNKRGQLTVWPWRNSSVVMLVSCAENQNSKVYVKTVCADSLLDFYVNKLLKNIFSYISGILLWHGNSAFLCLDKLLGVICTMCTTCNKSLCVFWVVGSFRLAAFVLNAAGLKSRFFFFFFKHSVQFSCSALSDSLWPHEPRHTRPPWPSPTPRVHPNPCPSSQWCRPTISSSVVPFSSRLHSFPAPISA